MRNAANNQLLLPILPNQFEADYRDYWARHLPVALEYHRPVLESDCHVIRYYQIPDDRQATFTAAGQYKQTTLSLAPGSFVLGFQQKNDAGLSCSLQLTDQATGHKLFSQPMPSALLFRSPGNYFLPVPMPVLAPGVLLVELWAQSSGERSLVLVVAELDVEYAVSRGCLNAC